MAASNSTSTDWCKKMAESSVFRLLCSILAIAAMASFAPAPPSSLAQVTGVLEQKEEPVMPSSVFHNLSPKLLAPAPAPAPLTRAQAAWALAVTDPVAPLFIFGDSTLDVGTNDMIPNCTARADFFQNGIDFPYGPTGRFSNGFNTADEIAKQMGYQMSPPPYLSLVLNQTCPPNIHRGANFASGGSGILNSTGKQFGKVMCLAQQIQQFSHVRDCMIQAAAGDETTVTRNISKALFLISVGSNDIFESPHGADALIQFSKMIATYEIHLERLYELGARKLGILSIPPIGCCPVARNLTGNGSCFGSANTIAQAFNTQLERIFQNFSIDKPIKYSLANMFDATFDVIRNPKAPGRAFVDVESACCGNANYPCNRTASVCDNRQSFLFWDKFHPTQAISELAAAVSFNGNSDIVKPMNFRQLLLDN